MGQKFQACGTSCGLTCLDLALNSNGTCQNKCVEGCQCPEGMKLDQRGNCVSIQDCPCIDDKGDLYEVRYSPIFLIYIATVRKRFSQPLHSSFFFAWTKWTLNLNVSNLRRFYALYD